MAKGQIRAKDDLLNVDPNFLKLQMTAAGNQNMAAGEHRGFLAREKSNRTRDIFRIEMFFQRSRFFDALSICLRHNQGGIR